jgi:EAL domain-containing protein (putative c-di-GMP-specific phosphodiesterase class I)/GGDEF domain-containing protein
LIILPNEQRLYEEYQMLSTRWLKALSEVDYAFQPIVSPLTGITFAVEALIRGVERAGFSSIEAFFDEAHREKVLFEIDLILRKKALAKFMLIGFHHKIKLFYNYDPRVLEMADHSYGETEKILEEFGLTPDSLCFELSERHQINDNQKFRQLLTVFKKRGFQLALDDFGAGFASFELFYHSEPDILKCDRFLTNGIDCDLRKKTFCSHIIHLAKLLGVIVIVEGVETEAEFQTCIELGCDLVQGFYLQKPTVNPAELSYIHPKASSREGKKPAGASRDTELLVKEITRIEPINVNDNLKILFDKFHYNLQYNFFPVVDKTGYPLGIIHEKAIKKYVYSPYGKDLLHNKSISTSLANFVSKCPTVDLSAPQERILEIYSTNPNSEGIIITKSQKYYGFLTAKSLLNLINEKNLAFAREINPLTRLPGNILINQFIYESSRDCQNAYYYIYYDFNDFKPFNDLFGFSQGDKAILSFAEILKHEYPGEHEFIGHIGGDDFFAGLRALSTPDLSKEVCRAQTIITAFETETKVLYSPQIVRDGFYFAKDREGTVRKISLLSACAGIIELLPGEHNFQPEEISVKLGKVKKEAKLSKDNPVVTSRF